MSEEHSFEEGESARIVIGDEHPLMRSALRTLLEAQSDLEVIGEAADGTQALKLCRNLYPEVVLLDLKMPEMDGLTGLLERSSGRYLRQPY